MSLLTRLIRDDQGQDLVEYTLLLVAAAFTGLALYGKLAPALNTEWIAASSAVQAAESINLGS